jgi:hypothetical protein
MFNFYYSASFFDSLNAFFTLIIVIINLILLGRERLYKLKLYYQPSKNRKIYLSILNEGVRDQYLREINFIKNKTDKRSFIDAYLTREFENYDDSTFQYHVQQNDKILLPYKITSGSMITLSFDIQLGLFKEFKDISDFYMNKGKITIKINNKIFRLSHQKIKKAKNKSLAL